MIASFSSDMSYFNYPILDGMAISENSQTFECEGQFTISAASASAGFLQILSQPVDPIYWPVLKEVIIREGNLQIIEQCWVGNVCVFLATIDQTTHEAISNNFFRLLGIG